MAIVDLVEAGVITNRRKHVHPGRIVTSVVLGTERLYRFVHDNPFVEFHPCDRTNDTALSQVTRSSAPAAGGGLVGLNTLQHWLWQRLQTTPSSQVAA